MSEMKNGGITVTIIPVDQIEPNSFNYNEMTAAEFAQYVVEVRRLGHPPKPIIVREMGEEQYEIVDGEHAWRASKEVGLREIPCEIREVDVFDSMLEAFKRNRGGKDNRVRLGKMFLRMMKARGLSCRAFAKEINVPESTIRTALKYAEAADLRNRRAGKNGDKEISRLKVRQVEMYLRLPEEMRDTWLDAGGDIDELSWSYEHHVSQIIHPLRGADLFWLLEGDCLGFRRSLEYALRLAKWRVQHERLTDVNTYVRAVAEQRLRVQVLDCLPCQHLEDDLSAKPLLPVETWRAILSNASEHTSDPNGQLALVESGVRVALREAGLDFTEVYGPHVAEMLQLLAEAPASVRDCDFLTVEERFALLTAPVEDVTTEQIQAAQEATLEYFKRERTSEPGKACHSGAPGNRSVTEAFLAELAEIEQQEARADDDRLFADDAELLDGIIGHLGDSPSLSDASIEGRPAAEVLNERLRGLDRPEFHLVASLVISVHTVDEACRRWLLAVNGDSDRGRNSQRPTDHLGDPPASKEKG